MTSSQIRQAYLDFFASKGHTVVPSAPIVVKNDPTLLFTNAGMNQFKDYFLGNKLAPYTRATDTQKCLRVSGKHNDLEEVGVDHYHHTMFEMLGNWSFGDYFKAEAIAWSWELLTEVYSIPKDRLYATVFEGDRAEKIPPSKIALGEWQKLLPADQIVFGNKKDNFWEMGDTGPCGPCTEIHVDMRPDAERARIPGFTLVNKDHPEVIEIWNNVFIQYNRKKDGTLEDLPSRHVDTGMGLERLVRVLQGKQSNYDTDLFSGTIAQVEKLCGIRYDGSDSKVAVAFRVLADHIRAICFCIADGQLPSNTGAGYVIRRILRRAVRYYYSYLQVRLPLLHNLVPLLAKQFETVFPELHLQAEFVAKVIKEEEDAFLRTLGRGLEFLDTVFNVAALPSLGEAEQALKGFAKDMTKPEELERLFNERMVSGRLAFILSDTFGFPLDLTKLICEENQFRLDEVAYEAELQLQKNRSRAATALDMGDWVALSVQPGDGFVGYKDLRVKSQVLQYRKVVGKGKEQYQLVLTTTPFYAESGAQVGDTGHLIFGDLDDGGEVIAVTDTRKEGDVTIHFVNQLPTNIDAVVEAVVDVERRLNTMYNHTATHLMHAALRQVLGTHVAQKGSLVNDERLRFDFSHFSKVTAEEMRQVELIINQKIRENIPVIIRTLPKEAALALGAMALFGEKYGNEVRVVTIDPNFSVELCGGTHVGHTGMIGLFVFEAEAAVAAGVRRLEAVTGPAAFRYFSEKYDHFKDLGELLKTKDVVKAVDKLIGENSDLKRRVEALEAKQLAELARTLAADVAMVNGTRFIGKLVALDSADELKKLTVLLAVQADVVVLAANTSGKASVAVAVNDATIQEKGIDANTIIKKYLAPLIQGGGGGQKSLATAGGQATNELANVVTVVASLL